MEIIGNRPSRVNRERREHPGSARTDRPDVAQIVPSFARWIAAVAAGDAREAARLQRELRQFGLVVLWRPPVGAGGRP